jgi:hypothetical protein
MAAWFHADMFGAGRPVLSAFGNRRLRERGERGRYISTADTRSLTIGRLLSRALACLNVVVSAATDGYESEASVEVKLELLTAATKLFFQRPPEVQSMLGRLLAAAVEDLSSQV